MPSEGKPTVLIIGSTGKIGQLVVKELEQHAKILTVRLSARKKEQVDKWKKEGRDAVFLDLDEPSTFAEALFGVERVFLCTGYTVAMLTQCKTVTDAARRANVQHIVHMGAFSDGQAIDPHYVWHELVESYIKASGIAWTNLHPNVFMENVFAPNFSENKNVIDFYGGNRVGWIAVSDIAKVAAVCLREGPEKHAGKDYWLSSETFNMREVADLLGGALGKKFGYALKSPDTDFEKYLGQSGIERWYLDGLRIWFKLVCSGEMGYIGTVRDDVPFVTGQPSLKLKDWIAQHKEVLLQTFKD
ncbi:hypothetical protein BV898_12971 [Hypsibius exemplaris]|uniref:NmrA-like domain-containing protein n=1 Tax=Hypsibius exemplaris TaxID=2072580 RepID=A0A1W0WC30_HYPEX|nr:hypothetical protein BV898_12971 [Hypsibius exemplaris]